MNRRQIPTNEEAGLLLRFFVARFSAQQKSPPE
jgi:hypothetical protein